MKRHLLVIFAAVTIVVPVFVASASAENVLIFRNSVDSPNVTVAKGATVTWMDRSQLNAHVEFTSPNAKGVLLQATKAGLKATFTEPGVYEYTVYLSPETSTPHQLQGRVMVK
jgi:plastocyanin